MNDDEELCHEKSDEFSDDEPEITNKNIQTNQKSSIIAEKIEPETPVLRYH